MSSIIESEFHKGMVLPNITNLLPFQ